MRLQVCVVAGVARDVTVAVETVAEAMAVETATVAGGWTVVTWVAMGVTTVVRQVVAWQGVQTVAAHRQLVCRPS